MKRFLVVVAAVVLASLAAAVFFVQSHLEAEAARGALEAQAAERDATQAIATSKFLESLGVVSTFPDRGQPLDKTVEMLKYAGFGWVRGGIEGVTDNGPTTVQTFLDLSDRAGVKISWGLGSSGTKIDKLIETARPLADAGALLAFEGNNEPNNWGVTYQREKGGGRASTWLPVAKLQRDMYAAVNRDKQLKKYPVWSLSEGGAQVDNVGVQFLTIPDRAETLLPAGTTFADFANVHNYVYHRAAPGLNDNKTWNAADPTSACKIDGLYKNYGLTWNKKFRGYSQEELVDLPRVTTETGCKIEGEVTEEIQALNLLSLYLDQFKRGWSYTAVYLLRDRTDEQGNQTYGLFKPDYSPRKAALYLHNLTTILADRKMLDQPGRLAYSIEQQPDTVHDLLLERSDRTLQLVVWGERLSGADKVTVRLGGRHTSVQIYDPTVGTESVQKLDNVESVTVELSNHPLVIAISRD